MNKRILTLLAPATVLVLFACSPKGGKSTAKTTPTNEVTDAQFTAAKTKFPEVTMDELKKGNQIYYTGACTKCHSPQNIQEHTEGKWKKILDEMARKAELSASDKDAVWKYVMAVKTAGK